MYDVVLLQKFQAVIQISMVCKVLSCNKLSILIHILHCHID